jgi:hypothetical protein
MHATGLEQFGLNKASFRRLGNRNVRAYVSLRTYDVTPPVKNLPPSKRLAYVAARVGRWIEGLVRLFPGLSFQAQGDKLTSRSVRGWSQLPSSLIVAGPARQVLALADAAGVNSVYVTSVAGRRRRRSRKPSLEWYCVRAFVIIRIERAKTRLQSTEDRFILVRASSFEDAKKRLRQQWREYARPYLNSDGQMVSWLLDRVIDVYQTCETDIDPAGTEVYSKLGQRRVPPGCVWRPGSERRRKHRKRS